TFNLDVNAQEVSLVGTLPPGITFDPDNRAFSGTPLPGSAGVYTVRLTATTSDPVPVTATQVMTLFVAKRASSLVKPGVFTLPVSGMMPDADHADVPVALSAASASAVTVSYQTLDKTAKAGVDYTATSGTLTFQPGETLKVLHIAFNSSTQAGPNLVFQVKLRKPTGATLGLSSSVVTFIPSAGPMVAYVNNPVVQPASSGQTAKFVVSLSSPIDSDHNVSVPYNTVNGSAVSGVDYT